MCVHTPHTLFLQSDKGVCESERILFNFAKKKIHINISTLYVRLCWTNTFNDLDLLQGHNDIKLLKVVFLSFYPLKFKLCSTVKYMEWIWHT